MGCNRCNAEWGVTAGALPTSPVRCPYCNVHICGCGCGANLSGQRADSIWWSESHRLSLSAARTSDKAPLRSVEEARQAQEKGKPHWSAIVHEGICDVLRSTGGYHADDLQHLGIPAQHRNIIGSQTRVLLEKGWMVEAGRRRSEIPSRHGAKSGMYRITKLGVAKLVGVGGGNAAGSISSPSDSATSGHSSHSGENSAGSGSLFDADKVHERPRSAFTDADDDHLEAA